MLTNEKMQKRTVDELMTLHFEGRFLEQISSTFYNVKVL